MHTSPHPLHGYAASSGSIGESGNPTGESIAMAAMVCGGREWVDDVRRRDGVSE